MKNKKLLILVSVVAILAVGMFSTLAYLTDTARVTNVFTVGHVDIELDEADVNEDGEPIKNGQPVDNVADADRTDEGNEYKLVPGKTYTKDPTMTVKGGSEDTYARMILTVNNADKVQAILDKTDKDAFDDYADMLVGWDPAVWVYEGYELENNVIRFEFRYKEIITSPTEDLKLPALFTAITIPGIATAEELEGMNDLSVSVEAHAIQAVGFTDTVENGSVTKTAVDAAWEAFDLQYESANDNSEGTE